MPPETFGVSPTANVTHRRNLLGMMLTGVVFGVLMGKIGGCVDPKAK